MKIIHTGDIHLDSPLKTYLPSGHTKERREELFTAFKKVVDYAGENNMRVIIIAGDLFDEDYSTQRTRDSLLRLIRNNSQIDFIYPLGNHDEKSLDPGRDQIPDNLYIGKNIWQSRTYDDVCISYINFNSFSQEHLYQDLKLDEAMTNIVILHGEVTQNENSDAADKIRLNALKGKNIDYLALGHIHERSISALDARGIYVYCGCLEGRDAGELGPKGFYVIDTDDIKKPEFHENSLRIINKINVEINDCPEWDDFEEKVQKQVENIPDKDIVKIVINGNYAPNLIKNIEHLKKVLSRFYLVQVQDNSILEINSADYQNTPTFKGKFIATVLASGDLSKEDKDRIIAIGIKALKGYEI